MRITVTGAAGGIGRVVVARLAECGHTVCAVDQRPWPSDFRHDFEASVEHVLAAAGDQDAIHAAVRGSEAVVHLAAIPSPELADPDVVFVNNTAATFTVLNAAADARIARVIIASSVCALGLVYAPRDYSPVYAPVDEEHPLHPADPYALSKQCDELTAAMFARQQGMNILAFRFPHTSGPELIRERAAGMAQDPSLGKRELWAYLDVRDAAEACRLGLEALGPSGLTGFHAVNVMANDSMLTEPIADLVSRYHPDCRIDPALAQARCGYTLDRAERLFGFKARHLIHG